VSGDLGSAASKLVARLRETSEEFVVIEPQEPSMRDIALGLAQADVAVVVVDASRGGLERTKKQVLLGALGGVTRLVLAIDASGAGNPQEIVEGIEAEARRAASELDVRAVSSSAPSGHDVVALLHAVEPADIRLRDAPFRLPVAGSASIGNAAGASGTIASGTVRVDDRVRLQGQAGRVVRIVRDGQDVDGASAGDSVVLVLEGPSEVAPGDLVSTAERPAEVADQFEVTVAWFDETPLLRGRNYVLEVGEARRTATIGSLKRRIDPDGGARAPQKFELDEIGVCNLRLDKPIAFDPHRENRRTGAFRLVDPTSRAVVGVGVLHFALRRAQNVHWQAIDVNKNARSAAKGQRPCVLWYTGLSGAGKSTIANLVDKKLHAMGRHTYLLDGDNVRHGLNKDLGFTAADRVENIRRIAEVAKLMVDAGLIVGTAFISPFRAERSMARTLLGEGEFIEIFVDTPLGVAEERDPKGLYKKARRGELKNFTGIDSPYEAPENPELRIDTTATAPEAGAEQVVNFLLERGLVDAE
jgi:bifunctional enzyme CysN/CysC